MGLSGGLDSSFLLHKAVTEWHLRPFVFHIDCGWNLPVAESNIKKLCDKLNVTLHIEKLDFEELRQMQIAFFKAGHAGLDAPQDHAFIAQIDKYSDLVLNIFSTDIIFALKLLPIRHRGLRVQDQQQTRSISKMC